MGLGEHPASHQRRQAQGGEKKASTGSAPVQIESGLAHVEERPSGDPGIAPTPRRIGEGAAVPGSGPCGSYREPFDPSRREIHPDNGRSGALETFREPSAAMDGVGVLDEHPAIGQQSPDFENEPGNFPARDGTKGQAGQNGGDLRDLAAEMEPEQAVQIAGVACQDAEFWETQLERLGKRGGTFEGDEALCGDLCIKDRRRNRPCSRAKLDDVSGEPIHVMREAGHLSGQRRRTGKRGSHRTRVLHHFATEQGQRFE